MHPVLKNTYNYFENIKGKKLVILLLSLLVVFLTLGILLGQLPTLLNGKTNTDTKTSETTTTNSQALVERAGKVVAIELTNRILDTPVVRQASRSTSVPCALIR